MFFKTEIVSRSNEHYQMLLEHITENYRVKPDASKLAKLLMDALHFSIREKGIDNGVVVSKDGPHAVYPDDLVDYLFPQNVDTVSQAEYFKSYSWLKDSDILSCLIVLWCDAAIHNDCFDDFVKAQINYGEVMFHQKSPYSIQEGINSFNTYLKKLSLSEFDTSQTEKIYFLLNHFKKCEIDERRNKVETLTLLNQKQQGITTSILNTIGIFAYGGDFNYAEERGHCNSSLARGVASSS
jgi:hypothetical protein